MTPSPDDRFILVSRVKKPYSHLIPIDGFPQQVEIWNRRGEVARTVAEIPSREGVTLTGVRTGPREYRWRPDQPATLLWVEALDEGDLRNKVPFRDKIVAVEAPVHVHARGIWKDRVPLPEPVVHREGGRFVGESDRATRRVRTWILEPGASRGNSGTVARKTATPIPAHLSFAAMSGRPSAVDAAEAPSGAILQTGDDIYLAGDGASPEGDRPFLDRLNLKTLASERLFRSDATSYETADRAAD